MLKIISSTNALHEALGGLAPSPQLSKRIIKMPLGRVDNYINNFPKYALDSKNRIQNAVDFAQAPSSNLKYPFMPAVFELSSEYIVSSSRYIISEDNCILSNEEQFQNGIKGTNFKSSIGSRSQPGVISLNVHLRQGAWINAGIHLMHEYNKNYFHFIVETLPRLLLAEELGLSNEIPILIENNLHKNLYHILDLCNFNKRPILHLEPRTIYRLNNLFFPDDVTHIWDVYEDYPVKTSSSFDLVRLKKIIQLCKSGLKLNYPNNKKSKKKIFVTRSGDTRSLVNQNEIALALLEKGFEIINCDQLSVEVQATIFSQADIIVGPTGGQMTNILWCSDNAQIYVLASDHVAHQQYMWEYLGHISSSDVSIIYGAREHKNTTIYSLHDDYKIDTEKLISDLNL